MNLFDLIILALLALFVFLGMRRGLIMTLCGLVVSIAALIGAQAAADQFSPALAYVIQPVIQNAVQANVDQAVESSGAAPTFSLEEGTFLGQLVDSDFYQHFAQTTQQAVEDGIQDATAAVAQSVAAALAQAVAWLVLYVVAFVVILVVGKLLARVLNLAAALPGLHFLNTSLGGVCGLLTGLVLVAVLASLGVGFGLIPRASVNGSLLLQLFSNFGTVSF